MLDLNSTQFVELSHAKYSNLILDSSQSSQMDLQGTLTSRTLLRVVLQQQLNHVQVAQHYCNVQAR